MPKACIELHRRRRFKILGLHDACAYLSPSFLADNHLIALAELSSNGKMQVALLVEVACVRCCCQGRIAFLWLAALSKRVVVAASFGSHDSSIAVAFKAAAKRQLHLNGLFCFFWLLKNIPKFRFSGVGRL